jgi:prepilin-type N-terminal cleavage/methylation domain-containing protein
MRTRQQPPSSPRPAFTLVELIVAMLIVAAIAGLAVAIVPRLQDSQRATKGGDVVQGSLFLAKQLALRDQQPRGIRLVLDASGTTASSLQLIEQPPYYAPTNGVISGAAWNPAANQPILTAPFFAASGLDFWGGNGPGNPPGNPVLWAVQPGDYLDLGSNNRPEALYLITAVNAAPSNPSISDNLTLFQSGNQAPLLTSMFQTSPQAMQGTSLAPAVLPFPFRILRAPRPMAGQQPIKLPPDIVVDLSTSKITPDVVRLPPPANLPVATHFDILFSPSGQVMGTAGTDAKVILWVRDNTPGGNAMAVDQTLVTVYTRTGSVASYPVNLNQGLGDPYYFVTEGRGSGM